MISHCIEDCPHEVRAAGFSSPAAVREALARNNPVSVKAFTLADAERFAPTAKRLLAGCLASQQAPSVITTEVRVWNPNSTRTPVAREDFNLFREAVAKSTSIKDLAAELGIKRTVIDRALRRGSCGLKLFNAVVRQESVK